MIMWDLRNIFKRESVVIDETQASSEGKKEKAVQGGDYKEKIVYVNSAETAMKIAAVFRAVNLISSGVAVLNMQYKRRNRAKDYFMKYEANEGKTINYLLSMRPNSRQNSFVLFKNLVSQILLRGNAYVLPRRDSVTGRVSELVLLDSRAVSYDVYYNRYTVMDSVNGVNDVFEADEILHFKNICMDGGYLGISTISYAAQTLGIAATADAETLKRFGTGGRFKAILQNNNTVRGIGEYQDKQMEGMKQDLQDDLNRGDDILLIKGDNQITPLSMSSADMQFLESRKFTIREIARFFNVPPSKLMDDTNSNYKSAEMANVSFYDEALKPIVTEIEREFNAKMLTDVTYQDYKYCYDLRALYALDLESKAKWDKARLDNGQCSVNDLRRESDKEPVENGDEIYLSVNLAPLGSEKLRGGTGTAGTETNKEDDVTNKQEPEEDATKE